MKENNKGMKKIVLNLGCGQTYIKNAVNADFYKSGHCDKILDLSKLPWPWEDNSVDEIYMLHILEHFDCDMILKIFKEANRVLKPNGLLHIQCPHFSSMLSLTCIDHKKAFSITTFDFLGDKSYLLDKPLFKKEFVRINYLMMLHRENKFIDFEPEKTSFDAGQHPLMRKLLWPFRALVQSLIDLSPAIFERCWCYLVGGADEIVYRGRKI
jgi:SAM-dependent methyltransferase